MPNNDAVARLTVTYVGPSNENTRIPQITATVPYQSQAHGTIDVPDTTVGNTSYDIPMGSLSSAGMALVVNKTGQVLNVTVNESEGAYVLADGEAQIFVAKGFIVSMSAALGDVQAGAGIIEYHLFGDPA